MMDDPNEVRMDLWRGIAAMMGVRFATREFHLVEIDMVTLRAVEDSRVELEFRMLGPGESPPAGQCWTIWEQHSGQWVGRSV